MEKRPDGLMDPLKTYMDNVKKISDIPSLNIVCGLLKQKLRSISQDQVNLLIVNNLCTCILSKIMILVGKRPLPRPAAELVEVMMEKELMPAIFKVVYQQRYFDQLDVNFGIKREETNGNDVKELIEFGQTLDFNIGVLLDLSKESEKIMHKTYGYSFLDLKGGFLWCDSNSERLFELARGELTGKLFFKMMIPFSAHLLKQRFGNELMGRDKRIGSSVAFSYVIYSKKAMNKYLKQLRKRQIRSLKNIPEEKRNENKAIYFHYMKALSSRATLVVLKYKVDDLLECSNPKYGANVTGMKGDNLIDMEIIDEESEVKLNEEGFFYKMAIMLETRIARTIPEFDYVKMLSDPVIKEFERIINIKIENKYSRV